MDEQNNRRPLTIDPVKYGRLLQTVENLDYRVSELHAKISKLETDIRSLLELADKGRGAFWAGMTLMSIVSGVVGYLSHVFTSAPK